MHRDRALQIRMLREVRSKEKEDYGDIPTEVLAYNAALLIEEGLVRGRPVKGSKGQYVGASLIDLTSRGHDVLDQLESPPSQSSESTPALSMTAFISHSSADQALAGALARLIRSAFNLPTDEIRCTSVDEFRLPAGANTDDQLRQEVRGSKVFVGIITPSSIESAYVLFELGARWGAKLSLFPVLARGAGSQHLKGPLSGINALDLTNPQMIARLLEDISSSAKLRLERLSTLEDGIAGVASEARKVADNKSKPSDSHKMELRDDTLDVLLRLFKTGRWFSEDDIARSFTISYNVAKFHVDQLKAEGLIEESMDEELSPIYAPSAKGRALVMNLGSKKGG